MLCSNDKASCTAKCLKIGLLVLAGIAALGALVMLLWNWLLPALFMGAQPVSYFQAMGILLLSKILFGSFRCHGHKQHPRWDNMSAEEREQLKGRFKQRWGCCSSKGEDKVTGE